MKYALLVILSIFFQCTNKQSKVVNHQMPEIINELIKLQDEKIYDGEEFEFWIDFHDKSRYSICPIDAIPFASTGNNGIHFAFLTDFGRNANLNEAPIICVAPSYDPPINLVANNLKEFLGIITTVENSTLLADRYENQTDFENQKNEWFEGFLSEPKIAEPRRKLASLLKSKFKLEEFNELISYRNQIREERKDFVDFSSMDGLGVFKVNDEEIFEFKYSKKPEDVIKFLSNSNRNSRLLFYRNSYFAYILSKDYDEIIRTLTIQFLEKDGYFDEAKRLKLYK